MDAYQKAIVASYSLKFESYRGCFLDRGWKAPESLQLRLDVDDGIDEVRNLLSEGEVVREHLGVVVGAKATLHRHPSSVKTWELLAIRLDLDFFFCSWSSRMCVFIWILYKQFKV